MMREEATEQTAPSFRPIIKAAVGGGVWERSGEDGKRPGSGLTPSGASSTVQDMT